MYGMLLGGGKPEREILVKTFKGLEVSDEISREAFQKLQKAIPNFHPRRVVEEAIKLLEFHEEFSEEEKWGVKGSSFRNLVAFSLGFGLRSDNQHFTNRRIAEFLNQTGLADVTSARAGQLKSKGLQHVRWSLTNHKDISLRNAYEKATGLSAPPELFKTR